MLKLEMKKMHTENVYLTNEALFDICWGRRFILIQKSRFIFGISVKDKKTKKKLKIHLLYIHTCIHLSVYTFFLRQ